MKPGVREDSIGGVGILSPLSAHASESNLSKKSMGRQQSYQSSSSSFSIFATLGFWITSIYEHSLLRYCRRLAGTGRFQVYFSFFLVLISALVLIIFSIVGAGYSLRSMNAFNGMSLVCTHNVLADFFTTQACNCF